MLATECAQRRSRVILIAPIDAGHTGTPTGPRPPRIAGACSVHTARCAVHTCRQVYEVIAYNTHSTQLPFNDKKTSVALAIAL